MPAKLKMGRLSKEDWGYIRENIKTLGVDKVADKLKRTPAMIEEWVRNNMALDVSDKANPPTIIEHYEIKNQLRATADWAAIQEQFVPAELALFENKYAKLMSQFRNDVTSTEEMQVIHLIKFDILMDRNLKSRARALQDIERLERDIEKIYKESEIPMEQDVKDRVLNLESQLVAAREAEQSKTNEYVNLSGKHTILMKDLKATRDQRVSKDENLKETYVGLLKQLQEEEFRKQEAEDIELMRIAMETERERLSQTHKYIDGNYDKPLLTPNKKKEKEDD